MAFHFDKIMSIAFIYTLPLHNRKDRSTLKWRRTIKTRDAESARLTGKSYLNQLQIQKEQHITQTLVLYRAHTVPM
jgi:hypothetical protein